MRAENRTYRSIGRAHGVTHQRAQQIISGAGRWLVEAARRADPAWSTKIRELLRTRTVISDEELSQTLRDASGVARASLLVAEGLCHPRAWSKELSDHWALKTDALDALLRELAKEAPYRKDELREHATATGIPESLDIRSIMSAAKSPLTLDDSGVWVRRGAKKRDAAYLWLADQGEPRRAEAISEAIGQKAQATTEALRRDNRFRQVRPEGTWALTEWPRDGAYDYSDALEAMIEILTELGPLSRRDLTAELRRRYLVSNSRIHQCLISARVGLTYDGRIGLVERGAISADEKEPRQPDNAVHNEESGLLAFRLKVDKDIARGSGVVVSPWITWRLGLRQAPMERIFTIEGSGRQITFRRGTAAAQMSSVRLEAAERGMALGCELAAILRLEQDTMTIRHVCDPDTCAARSPDS
ncbi:RNA polymerase subunit sigma-70 [Acrocarpospora pleiomorpha]|nr:RNA polymerase subunit sigma-70 [Acrocarpospora pleiomorpha]